MQQSLGNKKPATVRVGVEERKQANAKISYSKKMGEEVKTLQVEN